MLQSLQTEKNTFINQQIAEREQELEQQRSEQFARQEMLKASIQIGQAISGESSSGRTPASGFGGGCGIKPIPPIGHTVGRCVDGQWEMISNSPAFTCGIKPIPPIGHVVGRCVNGTWELISTQPTFTCGIKPIPNIGCKIGRCVSGAWEQICN